MTWKAEVEEVHSVSENVGVEEGKYRRNMEYFDYESCSPHFE